MYLVDRKCHGPAAHEHEVERTKVRRRRRKNGTARSPDRARSRKVQHGLERRLEVFRQEEIDREPLACIRGRERDDLAAPVRRRVVRFLQTRIQRSPIVAILVRVDAIHGVGHRLLAGVVARHRGDRGVHHRRRRRPGVLHRAKAVALRSIEGRSRIGIQERVVRIVPCAAGQVATAAAAVVPRPLFHVAGHVNGAVRSEAAEGRCGERSRPAEIAGPRHGIAKLGTRGLRPVIDRWEPLAAKRCICDRLVPAHAGHGVLLLADRRRTALPGRRPGTPSPVAEERHRGRPVERLPIPDERLFPVLPLRIAAGIYERLELGVGHLRAIDQKVRGGDSNVVVEAGDRQSHAARRHRHHHHLRWNRARRRQRHDAVQAGQNHQGVRRAQDFARLESRLGEPPPKDAAGHAHVLERRPSHWMPAPIAADQREGHVGALRRRRDVDRPGNTGPETREHRIVWNGAFGLGGEHVRLAVPIEIRQSQRFGQRDVARGTRAARPPGPQTGCSHCGHCDHDRDDGDEGSARTRRGNGRRHGLRRLQHLFDRLRHLPGVGVAASGIAVEGP